MSHPLESLFLEHLPTSRRIAASISRRHGLRGDEVEDWISWVCLRLVEDDYAILRKFRGESSLPTYLTVVVAMLFRDYRVQQFGRWRASALALRRGPVAVRLETLVRRDGVPFRQAAEMLRSSGETTLSDRELGALLSELRVREPLRPVDAGSAPLAEAPAQEMADATVLSIEAAEERDAAERLTAQALATLPAEDQVILRMRFWEGLSIADIARALGLEQKPLYRRIERALIELRRQLESRGFSREHALALLEEPVT